MSNWRISIADLIFVIALAAVFISVPWLAYLQVRERRRRTEMIHQERLVGLGIRAYACRA